ncbi:MAG: peptidase S11 [Burkholderiales bacterium]|nr:peptidase S11 [Burkholderiales bacterium]
MTNKTPLVAALLLTCAAAAWFWAGRIAPEPEGPVVLHTLPAPAAPPVTAAPAPGASAPPAEPARAEAVEDVEMADTASTLEKILPRRSIGHATGLDKVEDPLRLGSSAALVLEAVSRKVIYSKNEASVLPIASITKLMTGLVIAEAQLPMEADITITDEDVDTLLHSRSRLKVGTVLTRAEALHLALMSSENRAAHALGRTYPAGLQAFVAAMNAKARQLGMASTHYEDPTGLSSGNRSSASDLATLVLAASGHPLLRDDSTTAALQVRLGKRTLQYNNSNRLVKDPLWDIHLQKTGYIVEAGHCMVMRTRLAGRDVVMVLLDAASNSVRSADAQRVRSWMDPHAPVAREPREERKPAGRIRRTFSRP